MTAPSKITIDAPAITPATGGFIGGPKGINVTAASGYELFYGVDYVPHLQGKNVTVPVSAGLLAAPVLVKGTTATSGGVFTAGAKFWKVTAVDGSGETAGSNEVTATLVLNGTQALSWAAVPGAQLYRVYRGTATGAENTLIATLGALATGYTDTGAAGTAKAVPTVSTAGPAPAAAKVFAQITGSNESVPFKTYRGVDVSLLRFNGESASLVEEAYKCAESYGVEANVQSLVLTPKAVDLRPATTITNPRLAIGLLEQYIRDNYSGQGVITGNALALDLIEDALEGTGTELTTKLGTPVVLAGGYGSPADTAANKAKLYISGQINIWRGPVTVDPASDLAGNRELALAEGQYSASVDGPVAVLLVGSI